MNTNLRAILFGAAVAAALTVTLDTVTAAEPVEVIRLETVHVIGHRADAINDGIVRLDPVVVIGHRDALVG